MFQIKHDKTLENDIDEMERSNISGNSKWNGHKDAH